MQVGGNIKGGRVDGSTQAMGGGTIEYGGACLSSPSTSSMCGSWEGRFENVPMNTTHWRTLFEELQEKSASWSSLTPNGQVKIDHLGPDYRSVTLENGDDDCVQVFAFSQDALSTPAELIISPSLSGKTMWSLTLTIMLSWTSSSTSLIPTGQAAFRSRRKPKPQCFGTLVGLPL